MDHANWRDESAYKLGNYGIMRELSTAFLSVCLAVAMLNVVSVKRNCALALAHSPNFVKKISKRQSNSTNQNYPVLLVVGDNGPRGWFLRKMAESAGFCVLQRKASYDPEPAKNLKIPVLKDHSLFVWDGDNYRQMRPISVGGELWMILLLTGSLVICFYFLVVRDGRYLLKDWQMSGENKGAVMVRPLGSLFMRALMELFCLCLAIACWWEVMM